MLRHPFRILGHGLAFGGMVIAAAIDYLLHIWLPGRHHDYARRASWLQRWSSCTLRLLHIQISCTGTPPNRGLLVANHQSYVDVLALASQQPSVFIAKSEVRRWPVIGWLTQCAGTLYITREKRSDVRRVGDALGAVVGNGQVVVLFPEGTSTNGHEILPFHASLLAPAAALRWPVTPAWVGYQVQEGSVEEDVCYWRDMSFAPHFLRLVSHRDIQVHVEYGSPLPEGLDRKAMARQLHAQITEIAAHRGYLK
jgi:lyso-ornithine lipid O-acyltransferase